MYEHDLTAPGFDPDAAGLPWFRRSLAQGLGYFAPSIVFLGFPLWFAWGLPFFWPLLALDLVIAALYLGSTLALHLGHTLRWLWVAALITALLATAWVTDQAATPAYYTAYVACVIATMIPWRQAVPALSGVALGGVGLALLGREPFAAIMAFTGGLIGFSIALGIQNGRTREALRREEQRTATLAVAAERERIGRDLHDILGHSLTTIAVKADLAQRLVARDPDAAAAEIESVAAVARQALADVRATASGMREVRLATEIAAARSVLGAAGIECRVPSALPGFADADSELLGYVVREAVTT